MSRITSALFGATALVALSATPSLAASVFDGPYVGVYTGYSDAGLDATTTAGNSDKSVDGWAFGGYAGYGRTFDRFYFGGEGEVGYNDTNGKLNTTDVNGKIDGDVTYGLSARAGYLVSDTLLAYGRVGWERSKFELKGTAGGVTGKDNVDLDGIRFGGGVEAAVLPNVLVRAEYTYTNYENKDFTLGTIAGEAKPDESALRVGVAYRF